MTKNQIKDLVGKQICLSDWVEITQERINAFAECTEDRQWIHVDEKKAAKGPNKSTVAHGFLLLSLLPHFFSGSEFLPKKFRMLVHYGLDRVRFINPVKSGSRVRNRAVLKEVRNKGARKILLVIENTIEIESEKKPALVAEILALLIL